MIPSPSEASPRNLYDRRSCYFIRRLIAVCALVGVCGRIGRWEGRCDRDGVVVLEEEDSNGLFRLGKIKLKWLIWQYNIIPLNPFSLNPLSNFLHYASYWYFLACPSLPKPPRSSTKSRPSSRASVDCCASGSGPRWRWRWRRDPVLEGKVVIGTERKKEEVARGSNCKEIGSFLTVISI
jgi:hypothetical protein